MTPAGIEPANFRFVAQNLIHCARWSIVKSGPTVSYELTDLLAMYTRPEMKLAILVQSCSELPSKPKDEAAFNFISICKSEVVFTRYTCEWFL